MDIDSILSRFKRVAVIGISANSSRPSHWIARYLQDHGYEVVGQNPGLPKIDGIRVVSSLQELPQPFEIVNVYRSPDAIPALVEELAAMNPRPPVLWLQPGAQNAEAEARARELGMTVISGPCIYQELEAKAS